MLPLSLNSVMVVCKESLLYGLQNRPTLLAKLITCRPDYCSCPLLGCFLPTSPTSSLSSSSVLLIPTSSRASGYLIIVFFFFFSFLLPPASTPCAYSQSDMTCKSVPMFLKLSLYFGYSHVSSPSPCSFQHQRCCPQYCLP